MKRCPTCSFLYLDSDNLCDLDQSPLVADDFGTDMDVVEPSKVTAVLTPPITAGRRPRLNVKTFLAATLAVLMVGLMVLLSYQRMRPNLLASPAPTNSQVQASKASRVSQIARQVLNEASARAAAAEAEPGSPAETDESTSPTTKPSNSSAEKANGKSDASRLPVSRSPVSTGTVSQSGRGPVTIQLANGSVLQADEVWRTKAGIWYRRKGIVTFLKPERVRAMHH